MKKVLLLSILSLFLLASCQESKTASVTIDKESMSEIDKVSYSIGLNIYDGFKQQKLDSIDIDLLAQAMKDLRDGNDLAVEEADAMGIIQNYMKAKTQRVAEAAASESAAFFAENGKKEGVITTASGLQYEVLKAGTGAMPTATDNVTVHYKGTLLDGTEFDSSYKRNEPTNFGVSQVIPGWTEGLQLMKTGAKYKFYIPSKIGYGERGSRSIPPNATLIFEVELISINEQKKSK